ncbi:MAG: site-2 protease family protein [Flavonifractor plautii]
MPVPCTSWATGWASGPYEAGGVTALRITCVGAEMRLSARCPLGCWQQIAAALAGPAVNLLAARMAAGLGTEGAYCFAGLNLALAAFNLLPAVQLDGGRILWCILALLTSGGTGRTAAAGALLRAGSGAGSRSAAAALAGRKPLTLLITALWLLVPPAAKPCPRTRMGYENSACNPLGLVVKTVAVSQ